LKEMTAPLFYMDVGVGLGMAHMAAFDAELVVVPVVNDEDLATLSYMRGDRHQRPVNGLYFLAHFLHPPSDKEARFSTRSNVDGLFLLILFAIVVPHA